MVESVDLPMDDYAKALCKENIRFQYKLVIVNSIFSKFVDDRFC
jgi:hypothetical protein